MIKFTFSGNSATRAKFLTLLRDPVDCFESNYVYMGLGKDINEVNLEFEIMLR